MSKEKLFVVAIFALKPDQRHMVSARANGIRCSIPQTHDCDAEFDIQPDFNVGYEFAETREAAVEIGLERAKEFYPEPEGWTLHQACAQEIYPEDIVRASANLSFGIEQSSNEKSTDDEWPDTIM